MYVLDVIALSPTSPAGSLSYRSLERLAPGTIVTIPLRRSQVRGIVIAVTDVRDAKALLKSASFALAKSVTKVEGQLAKPLFRAAESIATYHAAPIGSVLHALLSDLIAVDIPRIFQDGDGHQLKPVEHPLRVRFRKYRSRIEEDMKEKRATLLIAPSVNELMMLAAEFADLEPLILSGELSTTARTEALKRAHEHDGLILATAAYVFLPVRRLGSVIVERVSAGSYRMPRRPYLDRVRVAIELARTREIPLLLGDYPLPLEYRPKPGATLFNEPKGAVEAIDVRKMFEQGQKWTTVPPVIESAIKKVLKENGRVVILAARKGYAPSVVCRDCGTTLRDPEGRAYALATANGKRVLRTADGVETSAKTLCPLCGSWNLIPLGVGIERVYEDVATAFPEVPVVRFDADSVKTDAAAKRALKAFKEKRGILIGTESSLSWLWLLGEQVELSVVASIDSLLALPFWRSRERFVRIGLMLREAAARTLIQTRAPEDAALGAVLDPNNASFFEEEASLRKALTYPPYGTLVAVQSEGSKKRLLEAKILLIKTALPYAPTILPERSLGKKGFRQTALLQIPERKWPEAELSERFQNFPPFMKTLIDPESFW